MWKIQYISGTQIVCEINFGHLEASKPTILTIWAALNFEFLGIFDIDSVKLFQKSTFKASKIVKMAFFDLLKPSKIDFT